MKKIVVVGGGAAGWMCASYLASKKKYDITVIESPQVGKITIGGSTTPYLKRFFDDIGYPDESYWMPKMDGTYKLGVLYEDWDYKGSRWWNSFESDENKYPYWNKQRSEEDLPREDFFTSCTFSSHIGMKDEGRINKDKDGKDAYVYRSTRSYGGYVQPHAYNLDAGKLGDFLQEHFIEQVTHIEAHIEEVIHDEDGVSKLIDTKGNEHTADLFIDCTGFKRLLIDKVCDTPRKSLDPYLTLDKAMVMPVAYIDAHREMTPRTGAKAMSSGWMWNIPLYSTMINGYVYDSRFITDEEAESEMRADIGDRVKDIKPFIIPINTGHYTEPYSKNVVAVGLSAGFIEPIEATLLMNVQFAAYNLHKLFEGHMTKEIYNDITSTSLEDTLDFISTGYYMSNREDSAFWRSRGKNTHITDRMKSWLETCKKALLPPIRDVFWIPSCWISKLIGFGYFPEKDGFEEKEPWSLPTYSGTNFEPRNKHKYKYVDEINAKRQMEEIRNFDTSVFISQKEYLDRFIYKSSKEKSSS